MFCIRLKSEWWIIHIGYITGISGIWTNANRIWSSFHRCQIRKYTTHSLTVHLQMLISPNFEWIQFNLKMNIREFSQYNSSRATQIRYSNKNHSLKTPNVMNWMHFARSSRVRSVCYWKKLVFPFLKRIFYATSSIRLNTLRALYRYNAH